MPAHHRYDSRQIKSEKILAVLRDVLGSDLSGFDCLDVGCASGAISGHAAGYFRQMVGIDLDRASIFAAAHSPQAEQMKFLLASGHAAPFPAAAFDVIICAQVYEHSTDQPALASEIYRLLRPGGVCFFSGPNRLRVMEEHYWLPFLSWLPHPLADWYMRIFRRGDAYDAYPLFFWQIRKLWQRFQVVDYTFQIIKEPEKFAMGARLGRFRWIKSIPDWFLSYFQPFLPNYNWVLIKK